MIRIIIVNIFGPPVVGHITFLNFFKTYRKFLLNKLIIIWSKNLQIIINKTGFRPVSRQQQDRFRNKLFPHLSCHIFCCLFWACFFEQDKRRTICLSMQYKSLLPFFRGGEGVCVPLGQHAAVKKLSDKFGWWDDVSNRFCPVPMLWRWKTSRSG